MKLLKRLMDGYHLARYLLILCAIGSLWWEGESVWGAGVLAILMVGIPLWKLLQRTTRTRQTVDVISGGIRVESAAGVSEEISAWEVGGLRVIRSGLLIYGQDGKRLGAVAWRTGDRPNAGYDALRALARPRLPTEPVRLRIHAGKRWRTAVTAVLMLSAWLAVGIFMYLTDQLRNVLDVWLCFLTVLVLWNGWRWIRDFRRGILITPNGITVTPAVGRKRQLPWKECRLVPNSAGVPELPHGISLEQLDNILPLLEGICARNSGGEAGEI